MLFENGGSVIEVHNVKGGEWNRVQMLFHSMVTLLSNHLHDKGGIIIVEYVQYITAE